MMYICPRYNESDRMKGANRRSPYNCVIQIFPFEIHDKMCYNNYNKRLQTV